MAMVTLLKGKPVSTKKEIEVSLTKVLTNAFKDPNFGMIFLGFLFCISSASSKPIQLIFCAQILTENNNDIIINKCFIRLFNTVH